MEKLAAGSAYPGTLVGMELDEDTIPTAVSDLESAPEVPGYRLMALVGRGSTARVWRARRVSDDALVAVKVLDACADEQALREHAVLQADAGEHVVRVHECLTIQGEGGEATVLVLDWMAGGSLSDVMAGRGFLNAGETVTVTAPLASALARLHRVGVVHGDVAPGNVLLDSTGRPVWGDLGCARLVGFDRAEVDVWGTEGFVAPEVLLGGQPSSASDVYGLGALAWYCLTGRPPGHIATRGELDRLAPGAPAQLVDVVRSCLEPDPAHRPEAAQLSTSIFDAAPAVPIRMTVPDDIATSLTRRIRAAAAEDAPGEEAPVWELDLSDPPARRLLRWPWRRAEDEDGEADRGRGRGHRPAHAAAGSSRPAWPVLLTLACAVGLALAVLVPWERIAQADPPSGSTAAAPATAAAPPPAVAPTDDQEGVLTDRHSLREEPVSTVTALAELRARMLLEQDRELLEDLTARDSPARRADATVLRQLADSGSGYEGLRFTVRSAEVVHNGDAGEVVVRAEIDRSAYTVDGAQPHPAAKGEPLHLELVFDERWRIAAITEP